MSLQFSGFTPTLELDLLGGFAILPAGNLLIVDAVPEYPKMRHNSSEEDAAVASIQLKLISCLSSQVLSNLKAQSIEGQYEATIPRFRYRFQGVPFPVEASRLEHYAGSGKR